MIVSPFCFKIWFVFVYSTIVAYEPKKSVIAFFPAQKKPVSLGFTRETGCASFFPSG